MSSDTTVLCLFDETAFSLKCPLFSLCLLKLVKTIALSVPSKSTFTFLVYLLYHLSAEVLCDPVSLLLHNFTQSVCPLFQMADIYFWTAQ